MAKYRTVLFGSIEIFTDHIIIENNNGKKTKVNANEISQIIPAPALHFSPEIKIKTKNNKDYTIFPWGAYVLGELWGITSRKQLIEELANLRNLNPDINPDVLIKDTKKQSKIYIWSMLFFATFGIIYFIIWLKQHNMLF